MAVLMFQDVEGMTPELYDALNTEMRFPDDAPEGLISHMASRVEGGMRIVDVWESEEHFGRFVEERLVPAMGNLEGAEIRAAVTPQEAALHNRWHR